MSKSLVIIPTAKLVPIELQAEFGSISPAMIPLDGRPALHYIIDQYSDTEFLVAIHEAGDALKAYVDRRVEHRSIEVHDVGITCSLGETLLNAIQSHKSIPERLVINFADTAVNGVSTEKDCIHFAKKEEVFRWTTFTTNHSGQILAINEKETEKANGVISEMVFIGIFCFIHPKAFIDILTECVKESGDIDPFYKAVQTYSEKYVLNFHEATDWYDFGHLDTYYDSRKRISSTCREFNTIDVDSSRGRITKHSRNADKFIDEIQWYLKLPQKLLHIAPRVFDYDLDRKSPMVEMEFYGYPVLNDLYLYGDLDLGAWARIFRSIEQALSDMREFKLTSESAADVTSACIKMYETKTLDRINQYKELPDFCWANQSGLQINGAMVMTLNEVIEQLPQVLTHSGLCDTKDLSVIHGDPCLSNILFDRRNGIVRMIDPRGRFGSYDIYGDPLYDWAKLSHSIEGDYDFLVNDLFDFEINGSQVELTPHLSSNHIAIKNLYHQRVIDHLGINEHLRIRLLESLLFLSMIPLHGDRPRSQQAFLARGLWLFSEIRDKFTSAA